MTPLAIDLFCGLGGWTEGLIAEGYRVVGFDNERHAYGEARYPAQLVIQDVLTLHGSQFKNAALIVASPPCQAYSYRAMPWKRAKALPPPDNALFEACFRIKREACEASGRYIPLVVENVCGAQKWVGRARWHFGSFYLWGDVPALMPIPKKGRMKFPAHCGPILWKDRDYSSVEAAFMGSCLAHREGATKVAGLNWSNYGKPDYKAEAFNTTAEQRLKATVGVKVSSASGRRTDLGLGARFTSRDCGVEGTGTKQHGSGAIWFDTGICKTGSASKSRKAASAHIAKIPFELARHIASAWYPSAAA